MSSGSIGLSSSLMPAPSSPDRSSGNRQRIHNRGDIVHAEYARSALEGEDVGGDGAGQALGLRAAAGELAEEALARRADHDRPAERHDLAEPAQQLEVVVDGLAEADAGIEPHL